MYNYDLILTYKYPCNDISSNELYKSEFLKAFNLTEYDDKIISDTLNNIYFKQKILFKEILDYVSKNHNLKITLTPQECFPILFSWEFFYITHSCISSKNMHDKNNFLRVLWIALKEKKN